MVFTVIVHLDVKSEHVEKVKAKLIEASRTYVKDKGTIDWFVSQGKKSVLFCYLEEDTIFHSKTDVTDPTKFALVERYEQQSDLQTHIDNPYYKQFGAYVKPLLSKPLVCYYLNCYNSLLIVFDVTRNFTR
jgi:quinol monooxygenase YgiN